MTLLFQKLVSEILYKHKTERLVDSRSTFKLATSTKEPEEPLNKVDIAAIRQAFNNNKLQTVSWCPGYYLAADALTKDNRTSAALLLRVIHEGTYEHHALLQRIGSNAPDPEIEFPLVSAAIPITPKGCEQ